MKCIIKFLLLSAMLIPSSLLAQYEPLPGESPSAAGALTPEMLKTLDASVPITPQLQAVRDALANNSVRSLALNPDVENRTDSLFTKEIKEPGSIADQKQSGRCWLFAGLNALRPGVIAKQKMKNFMLSQAYEQFYQELEAANRSLELAIILRHEPIHSRRMDTFLKSLIGDGGNWNYVRALIQKYGAVPESVMPDDYSASHTDEMAALLATRLHKAVIEIRQHADADMPELRKLKMSALQDVYKILELCLGKPPQTFDWRYEIKGDKDDKVSPLEIYTPQSFCKKFLEEDLNRYVSFANYPGQPMHAHLEWSWERNMADQPNFEAVNIEMKEIVAMTLKSVMADQPVWFAADASAEGDKKKGLWLDEIENKSDLFGIDFSMSKADTLAYDNGTPNHAMVITGVDVRHDAPVKWKIENSWGKKAGDDGWFVIDEKWFDKHVFQVIIDRRFVPPSLLALADQKPILLPPWDPFTDWNESK
ncbi:MAG TPA: C1 family peptidase [Verrucomicrobiae bacterium]|jgi:bleomycin hydrolase|nr:C1 family peptidase [Verrucomicrobiae bacterium]